jgi:acyl carrier protein
MPPEENLTVQIQALLLEKLLLEVQSPDENLLETGSLDSVTLVQLLLDLEERFNVRLTLSELDLEDFSTVRGLARLVAAQKSGAARTRTDRAQEAPASAAARG